MLKLLPLLIGVFLLFFVGMLWVQVALHHARKEIRMSEMILKRDQEKRRDTIPYLLESFRGVEAYESAWRQILELRKSGSEAELEAMLLAFLQQAPLKNLNFLEAKKDVLDLTRLIDAQKVRVRERVDAFSQMKQRFPFSLIAR